MKYLKYLILLIFVPIASFCWSNNIDTLYCVKKKINNDSVRALMIGALRDFSSIERIEENILSLLNEKDTSEGTFSIEINDGYVYDFTIKETNPNEERDIQHICISGNKNFRSSSKRAVIKIHLIKGRIMNSKLILD